MKKKTLVSVVLVCYNRTLPILKRSLESVLFQTYKNTEVLIIDTNRDKDISGAIEQYVINLNKDNLKLISMPGVSNNKARNIGFTATKGEYVAFMDDDDEWATGKLERQLKLFDDKISLVFSNYVMFDSDGNKSLFFNESQHIDNISVEILGENIIGCTSMPIMKRHAFENVGGFNESFKANQDWDLWIRLLQNHEAAYSSDIAGTKHYSMNSISSQRYRRFAGWASLFINHASKYNRNKKQLKKALGHFVWEMFDRKLYLVGATVLPLYFKLKS